MTKPHISVIIPSKNEELLISACLESLKTQDVKRPYEILLADGHSKDYTRSIAKKYGIRIIDEERPGKCHGLQSAVRRAKGAILCFTEADCVVPPNWLRQISDAFTDHPSVAAVTGVYTYHHSTPLYNIAVKILLPASMYIARAIFGTYPLRTTNFAIRRTAMQNVGGFNTQTTELYDLDLSLRLKPYYTIQFLPNLVIQTSDRRVRGRILSFLREIAVSLWYVAILRKPVIKPVYENIR